MKDCFMVRIVHKHNASLLVLMSKYSVCIWHIHHFSRDNTYSGIVQYTEGHNEWHSTVFTTIYGYNNMWMMNCFLAVNQKVFTVN